MINRIDINIFLKPTLGLLLVITSAILSQAFAEPLAGYQWKSVRVGAGGFAPNIVYSQLEPGLAYLRTDMGGIYRWQQSQQRWIPLQDGFAESSYFGVESIALDPVDPQRVYAAVGMYKRDQAAILRSDDKGEHWKVFPVSFPMGGNEDGRGLGERLAVDPNNTQTLYFGSRHNGLQRSTDAGAHWQVVASFPHKGLGLPQNPRETHGGISFVLFDPSSKTPQGSSRIYVGVADPGSTHLFQSLDGGKSWAPLANQPRAGLLPVKAALDGEGNLYIAYCNGLGPNGVTDGALYKWHSQTGLWTDISPDKGPQTPAGGYMGLSLDPRQPGALAVSSMNRWKPHDTVWYSTNGGETWVDLLPLSRQDVSDTPFLRWGEAKADFGWWIAGLALDPFSPGKISYTTGATVYTTQVPKKLNADSQLVWRPWDQGIEQTAIITLNSLPAGAELLSGFGDISGFYHDDLNQSPRLMYTNPVFANTNNIDYAGANPKVVVRSGTPPHRAQGLVPTLAWSEDFGKSWTPLTSPADEKQLGLSQAQKDYIDQGNAAIIASADGKRFVVTGEQAYWTENKGKAWQPIKGLPAWVRPVADRVNGQVFYALDFATGKLYKSDNAAARFHALNSEGLPKGIAADQPHWREHAWPLLATPNREGDLWLVSSRGLFHSHNGGKTFTPTDSSIKVLQLSFGKAPPGSDYPSLFAIGETSAGKAIYRSDDQGEHWLRLNDDNHRYGQRFRTLVGDPKHFGRVYVGTDGRGIIYGEPQLNSANKLQ